MASLIVALMEEQVETLKKRGVWASILNSLTSVSTSNATVSACAEPILVLSTRHC